MNAAASSIACDRPIHLSRRQHRGTTEPPGHQHPFKLVDDKSRFLPSVKQWFTRNGWGCLWGYGCGEDTGLKE